MTSAPSHSDSTGLNSSRRHRHPLRRAPRPGRHQGPGRDLAGWECVIWRGNLTLRIKGFRAVSTPIGVESARRITTMTDLLSASALLIGKPCVAAVLWAWPLPVLMLDRISGKKVMETTGSDLGHAPPPRTGVLKSRACNAMTGAVSNSVCWSDESKRGNALGRLDWHKRPSTGETSRNVCNEQETGCHIDKMLRSRSEGRLDDTATHSCRSFWLVPDQVRRGSLPMMQG